MKRQSFDRNKHVYRSEEFVELVKDAIRFFNGTPVHSLPLKEKFSGSGVYSLYYTGRNETYSRYAQLNRLEYKYPIYVGKAVPKGWRQSRISHNASLKPSFELYSRIREHSRNIEQVDGITLNDFSCRFVIFEAECSDMISTIEAALIKLNRPLWNSVLDGFGNHTPGSGRFNQAKSDWDVIHPGRVWADKCMGVPHKHDKLLERVFSHLSTLGEDL